MRLIDVDVLLEETIKSMENNIHIEPRSRVNHNVEHRHFIELIQRQPIVSIKKE